MAAPNAILQKIKADLEEVKNRIARIEDHLDLEPEEVDGIKSVPLQIRVPKAEARAIRIAAAEREMSISRFLLACFDAFRELPTKHAK